VPFWMGGGGVRGGGGCWGGGQGGGVKGRRCLLEKLKLFKWCGRTTIMSMRPRIQVILKGGGGFPVKMASLSKTMHSRHRNLERISRDCGKK